MGGAGQHGSVPRLPWISFRGARGGQSRIDAVDVMIVLARSSRVDSTLKSRWASRRSRR